MQGCIVVSPFSGGSLEIYSRLGDSKKIFLYENEADLSDVLKEPSQELIIEMNLLLNLKLFYYALNY